MMKKIGKVRKTIRRIIRVTRQMALMKLSELSILYADRQLETKARNSFLRLLGMKIGRPVIIDSRIALPNPERVSIGNYVLIREECYLDPDVSINDYCTLSRGVKIITNGHVPGSMEYFSKGVVIERYAWIGAYAMIMPGVTIGEYSVVAPGAVVTRDVPTCTMVGGVPAKFIRTIEQPKVVQNQFGKVEAK